MELIYGVIVIELLVALLLNSTALPSPSPSKVGDIDNSAKVNILDYNILLSNFGKSGAEIEGHLDNNNVVNIFDYNLLLSNFGK